ncbi:hypothetical protein RHGRI_021114 [Rhododendron griersonianum]|uniref:Aspartyl-tRNA synthetase n=1 Tax=Rhododendron griersonianum TaxID=479676 RepID=A0AAV6JIW4_9ERIC|nr:hypothetical protein RHGRI_021114 [Rhododendron griersonianum]
MSSDTQNPPNPKEEEEEEEEQQPEAANNDNNNAGSISKKAAKKEAAKQQKLHSKAAAASLSSATSPDPLAAHYGDVPLEELQSKAVTGRQWTEVGSLTEELRDRTVLVRGRVQTVRAVSKKMAFLIVREKGLTVQCVLSVCPDVVSLGMVKFATGLSRESYVDVEGTVYVPDSPIKGASQQVEIQVRKVYCVSKAVPTLPINIEDAARSEVEIDKALQLCDFDELYSCAYWLLNCLSILFFDGCRLENSLFVSIRILV